MIIETYPSGPIGTNAYLVGCENMEKGIFIDPGFQSATSLLQGAKFHNLSIEAIFLTHTHWDHMCDAAILSKELDIPVFVHPLEAKNLQKPGSDGLTTPFKLKGVAEYNELEEGQIHEIGELSFSVIHTPGHSPGGVCFYFEDEKVLFSGDTLFKGTIGRLDLPTGEPDKMWESLAKLALLDPNTKVYPGHGGPTVLKKETWLKNPRETFG